MGFSNEITKEFITKLADALGIEFNNISLDTSLSSLDWDSIAIISAIAIADECFGVVISAEKIAECQTIGDIIHLAETN